MTIDPISTASAGAEWQIGPVEAPAPAAGAGRSR
jgi:hypothetical protein